MSDEDIFFKLRRANPVPDIELSDREQGRADETLAAILSRDDFGIEVSATTDAEVGCAAAATSKATTANPAGNLDEQRVRSHSVRARKSRTGHTRKSRPGLLAAVAAGVAGLLILPISLLPGGQHQATAQELLVTAAQASAGKAAPTSPTSNDYLRRVDRLGDTSVTSVYLVDAAGEATSQTTVEGPANSELTAALESQTTIDAASINGASGVAAFVGKQFGAQPAQTARGALAVLLTPGLRADRQQEAYNLLAGLAGTEVADAKAATDGGDDSLVTLARRTEGLEFSLIPATGQLVSVRGLVGPDVETSVAAAGIVGCVHVTGVGGPKNLSLACADDNYVLDGLKWSGWNSPEATATGQAWINTCDPDCASGEFTQLPVKVTASRQQSCGFNLDVYTRLKVEYSKEDSAKVPLAKTETIDLACG